MATLRLSNISPHSEGYESSCIARQPWLDDGDLFFIPIRGKSPIVYLSSDGKICQYNKNNPLSMPDPIFLKLQDMKNITFTDAEITKPYLFQFTTLYFFTLGLFIYLLSILIVFEDLYLNPGPIYEPATSSNQVFLDGIFFGIFSALIGIVLFLIPSFLQKRFDKYASPSFITFESKDSSEYKIIGNFPGANRFKFFAYSWIPLYATLLFTLIPNYIFIFICTKQTRIIRIFHIKLIFP